MKKIIALFLALIMCLPLCACNSTGNQPDDATEAKETEAETAKPDPTETKATIFTNEGNKVEMSVKDLVTEFAGNEARFNKIYKGATIEFAGTVKSISVDAAVYNGSSYPTEQNLIKFEEGWYLIIGTGTEGESELPYDLADYAPGQKLKVRTGILAGTSGKVVWLVGNERVLYDRYNTQTTTITVVE